MTEPVLSKSDVYERLTEVLVKDFGMTAEQLRPSARLAEDLDLDSIDWIDMAVALEVQTGGQLREQDLGSVRTIQDVVDAIYAKLKASSA